MNQQISLYIIIMSSINFKGSIVSDDIGDVPDREDDA